MNNQIYIDQLCKNILLLRQRSHLSQAEMADKLGISLPALQSIECGFLPEDSDWSILFRINTTFHIPPDKIFLPLE